MTQYSRYHRWLLSELISNKRCITPLANTIVLLGTLRLITKDSSIYPKGTILFEDETGKVPCLLVGYKKEWFTGTIVLLSWSFLINKQSSGKEVCHLEVHSEILFLRVGVFEALLSKKLVLSANLFEKRNQSSFLNQKFFQPNSSITATDMLFNLGRNPTEPLPKVNLIAIVNMKSVLYQSKDKITFIVTLHDSRSFIHIIFNGDHFIEYYKIIMVGEMYFFKDIKSKRTFNEYTLQFPVFEIDSIDSIEYINRELAITYNGSNPTEKIRNFTDLACSCFGYEGIITYVIDNALGLFVLDSEYILHLGKFPEYNPSITPYRLGMKLLLHNIHAIKFTMKEDIWRLDNNKNCPNFREVKVIFAACHCSTIRVVRFPSEIFESDSVSQKIISKFSSFRINNSFTLLELLWVQKVYYDFTKKFPDVFEDEVLLSNPRPSKSDYKKVENCPFSRLLRKYRVANLFKDLAQEYFNHKVYCCITEDNQEIDIRLPPISEVLQLINELVKLKRFSSEIYEDNQSKIFSQFEVKLEKTHLMGFLEGNLDGTLQLKDQTGTISAVNISFEKIQSHHLNNIWIIPEYEFVVERPSKVYLRFAIEKCFCFYAKSYDQKFHFNRSVFQIRHIFPTKLNHISENSKTNIRCKLQIETVLEYTSDLINKNTITFINISKDFIKILPAMHIGSFYELSFDVGKSEQIINSTERSITLNFDDFAISNITNLEFDDSSTFKDLFGKVIQPKILRLNDSSKNSLKNLKTSFLIEDRALNVREFLNGNLINILNDTNKLVTLKGLIASKEFQHSNNVGQSQTSLLLRIQDIQIEEEIIDVYISNISKYVIPIGLIPGQIIVLRKIGPRKSNFGKIYCYASGKTHISLQGYPKTIQSFHQDLDNTNLIDLFENKISIQSIFRVPCRINNIYEIIMQFVCEACEEIIENNCCPNGCNLGRRFYSSGRFKISDGTCVAIVTARDDIVARELLRINNDSYQKICKQIEKSRFFYEWSIFSDNDCIKNSLSDFISLKDIRRDVILFCRKKNIQLIPPTLELNALQIAEKSPIFELKKKLKYVIENES
ncbi:hypothetical protein RclHR1_02460012 [Rhizophagus clarus]|uniref:CST complex subunit CTC1 n=1 Tax=Rhizophagus clarus TaxID=94130 RepID=A0A2Z6R2F9_9GLOM|nr:hypothetical protein RclHR1_02460012 [Rhizophagus clarus]GES87478.1 CST complex subunit CTC1 [Rhizophagus clarus]